MSELLKNCYFISYALSAQNATSLRKRQEKGKWFNFFISLLATELLVHLAAENRMLWAWGKPFNIPLCPHNKCVSSFETPPFSKNERKLKLYWYWRNGNLSPLPLLYSATMVEAYVFWVFLVDFCGFLLFLLFCSLSQ